MSGVISGEALQGEVVWCSTTLGTVTSIQDPEIFGAAVGFHSYVCMEVRRCLTALKCRVSTSALSKFA